MAVAIVIGIIMSCILCLGAVLYAYCLIWYSGGGVGLGELSSCIVMSIDSLLDQV
jgi:hypothetical protein